MIKFLQQLILDYEISSWKYLKPLSRINPSFKRLNFVYSLSSFSLQKTEVNTVQSFDSAKNTIKNIYGIEYKKNSMVQVPLLNSIADQKDEKAMDYFASFFDDRSSPQNPLMLFNTACTYDQNFNDVKKAKTYLLKSINDARNRNNKGASDNAFRYLAKNIYWKREKNKTAAWKTLKEGFEYTKYYAYKYIGAQISVESKSNLDEGHRKLVGVC